MMENMPVDGFYWYTNIDTEAHSSSLMEQVTRGCVVELEDIRRDGEIHFTLLGIYNDTLSITNTSPYHHTYTKENNRRDAHLCIKENIPFFFSFVVN